MNNFLKYFLFRLMIRIFIFNLINFPLLKDERLNLILEKSINQLNNETSIAKNNTKELKNIKNALMNLIERQNLIQESAFHSSTSKK